MLKYFKDEDIYGTNLTRKWRHVTSLPWRKAHCPADIMRFFKQGTSCSISASVHLAKNGCVLTKILLSSNSLDWCHYNFNDSMIIYYSEFQKFCTKKNKCNDFILVVKFWYTCTCIWSKRRWIYGTLHSNERIFWWLVVLLYFQYLHNLHPIDKSILVSQECLQACKTAKIKNREIIIRILFHFGNRKKV